MSNEQTIIGIAVALLCVVGLWKERWFYEQTKKGRRLARWFGETRGLWILRSLLIAGAAFGLLLAANLLRPVQW